MYFLTAFGIWIWKSHSSLYISRIGFLISNNSNRVITVSVLLLPRCSVYQISICFLFLYILLCTQRGNKKRKQKNCRSVLPKNILRRQCFWQKPFQYLPTFVHSVATFVYPRQIKKFYYFYLLYSTFFYTFGIILYF